MREPFQFESNDYSGRVDINGGYRERPVAARLG